MRLGVAKNFCGLLKGNASASLGWLRSHKVLALVERLGNVSEASGQSDVSRDTICRHLKLVKNGGADAFKR